MTETTAQIEAPESQTGTPSGTQTNAQAGSQGGAPGDARAEKGSEKRRDARLSREIAIIVSGADALAQPFHEAVKTSSISCYGCKFRSKNYVPKGQVVTVEIRPNAASGTTRVMHGRVIWVQRPRKYRDLYQISVEFEIPGNVWGVLDPPASWFAHPQDVRPAAPPVREAQIAEPQEISPDTALLVIAQPPFSRDIGALPAFAQHGSVPRGQDAALTRERLDAIDEKEEDLGAAIARTVKSVAERAAVPVIEGVVREATGRAMAAIDKVRTDSHAAAEALAAKIRKALDEVLADQLLGDQALSKQQASEQHGSAPRPEVGAPPATPKLSRAERRRRKHAAH